ncbi:MAG: hypothetical protein K0S71_513 [Clostridia bacterium]|jgi:hypothetical protein|nr:hypothetical protein [Clostridia bacterium]
MKKVRFKLLCLLFFPITLLLNYLFSISPYISESIYSLKLNKAFIQVLSKLTGAFPFSLAELSIYGVTLLALVYMIHTLLKLLDHKHSPITVLFNSLLSILAASSVFYFLFMSMWGFNYLRPRLGDTLGIHVTRYTTSELAELYSYLIDEVNALSEQTLKDADGNTILDGGYKSAFERASLGYNEAAKAFPMLKGTYGSPKPILISKLMNYTGIAGIYFPFTGEANVNITLLDPAIPSTTLHEMAHQRGYANEDECNFISFLSSSMHPDVDFKYSGYLLALSHTSSALARDNAPLLHQLNQRLSPYVLQDITNQYGFWKQYEGTVEALSSKVNDTYLKANGVSDGEKSYGRMVDLLLGYYKLYIKE